MKKENEINCFRSFILNVAGKRKVVPVPANMTKERMNKCLAACRAYLCQCVYVEIVLAECFMQSVEASVEKKKCFKFGIKKKWTDCKKSLRASIKLYDAFAPNGGEYNEEFAITFYEKTSMNLYKLRDKLAVRLQRLGCGEMSGLYSNAIILYNLTSMCIGTYEALMQRLYELLHVNLANAYLDFAPILPLENSYDFMKAVMGKDFEQLSNKAITKELTPYFDKIKEDIFDDKTLDEAARNASEVLEGSARDFFGRFVNVGDFMDDDFKAEKPLKESSVEQ